MGSKEYGSTCKVLGIAPSARRRAVDNEIIHGMAGNANRSGLLGSKVARSNPVHLDIVSRPLSSEVAGKHFQSSLCRCIRRHSVAPQLAHHRTDINDLAGFSPDHVTNNALCYNEWSYKVYLKYFAKVRRFHLRSWHALDNCRIVHKDVDGTFLFYLLHRSSDFFLLGHIKQVPGCLQAFTLVAGDGAIK